MKKECSIDISIPTYRTVLTFMVIERPDKILAKNNEIMSNFGDEKDSEVTFRGRAYNIYYDKDNVRKADILVRADSLTHGVIAHELFHTVSYILHYCGIYFTHDSEEAYTHLLEYLTQQLYNDLNELKIKVE